MAMQTKVLRTHSILNYLILSGILMTLALMSGCGQSGGFSEENIGPSVPFALDVGGDSVAGEATDTSGTANIKFDATVPQDGSFDGTFNPDVDTVDSVCSFDCHPSNSVGGRCYTDDSEELGGTSGHSIEVTIVGGTLLASATADANHTGRFIECTVTSGQSCNASCVGRVPDNEPTRLDNMTLNAVFDETAISTGSGTAAGIRLAYLGGRDAFGDLTFAAAGGTVTLDTGTSPITVYGGFTPDLDFNLDANGNQYAEIQYTIDDRSVQTRVLAYISTSYPLEVTSQSYSNLLGIIQYCGEIGVCANPLDSVLTLTYFSPLSGASFTANAVSSTNLTANFAGTSVTYIDSTDGLAYVSRYDTVNDTFSSQNVSGTVTASSVTRLATNFNSGEEYVAYQRADDGSAVIARYDTNSGSFGTYATVSGTTDRLDMAADSSSGRVYITYLDANSVTTVAYIDASGNFVDTNLEAFMRLQFANFGFDSIIEVSNLEYDTGSDTLLVAITWQDASGARHLSALEYTNDAWAQRGANFADASAVEATGIEIKATSGQTVSTVISYQDSSGNLYAAAYDTVTQRWIELEYASQYGFTSADAGSRSAITYNAFTGAVYMPARDINGDTVVIENRLDNTGWATLDAGGIERGSIERPSIENDGSSITVSYEKDGNGYVERRTSRGRIIPPTDG